MKFVLPLSSLLLVYFFQGGGHYAYVAADETAGGVDAPLDAEPTIRDTPETIPSLEAAPAVLDSPISCSQVHVVLQLSGEKASAIAAMYQITVKQLRDLNPHANAVPETVPAGSPLCVAGKGKSGRKVGRVRNVVRYTTSPGDTCASILEKADPLLSLVKFVALNPGFDCMSLETESQVINLPKGTTISSGATAKSAQKSAKLPQDQDCIVGLWSEWSVCATDGTQTRDRVVYQGVLGQGVACPDLQETRTCGRMLAMDTTLNDSSTPLATRELVQLQPNQCPKNHYNGCSVPEIVSFTYYYLFTPACNIHDICYECNTHSNYRWFANKQWCDVDFYSKMRDKCNRHWSQWWQWFDRDYCHGMATTYLAAVTVGGTPRSSIPESEGGWWMNGCYWWPWEAELNNAHGVGFHPPNAGCGCFGKSCQYW